MRDSLRTKLRELLGVSGDLASVVLFLAAILAIVFGYPAPVLVIAVSASLALSLLLLWRLRSEIQERLSLLDSLERVNAQLPGILATVLGIRRVVGQIARTAATPAVAEPTPAPALSNWLPDPLDLATLALTHVEFERCHDAALQVAKPFLGDDAEARFAWMLLGHTEKQPTRPTPWINFNVMSASSMKMTSVRFYGSPETFEVSTFPMTARELEAERRQTIVTPWRTDTSWIVLVAASWRRMQPFIGSVVLTAVPSRLTGEECLWRVAYTRAGPDPYRLLTLRRGQLVFV